MTALTRDIRTIPSGRALATPATPAKKGFFTRLFDDLMEARMRQAEREIRAHLSAVPKNVLAEAGLSATFTDAKKLPFIK